MRVCKSLFILLLYLTILFPVCAQETSVDEQVSGTPIAPIVQVDFAINNLIWDSSDNVFAYFEKDTIYLRDAKTNKLIGTVDFQNVLDFAMYQEDAANIQIIASSKDGTLAVWTLPISTTDEDKEFLPVYINNPLAARKNEDLEEVSDIGHGGGYSLGYSP